ncbi:MAG: heparinase II/III family protein, partial [Kiritimatiellia bacterium]|nr:heparinase II/III family protein [Kiritimatiellia bacterium]
AILRTEGAAGLTSAMIFGEPGGFHGHFDKLGFVLFGFGQELGVDPGNARPQAYRMPIHNAWYRATLSHNTVVVDGVSQAPSTGRALAFGANERMAVVVAEAGPVYPDLVHRRLLAQTPEYLVVMDDLVSSSEKDRRFAWFYHNRGTDVISETNVRPTRPEKGLEGADYFEDYRAGLSEGWSRVRFLSGAVTTHVLSSGGPGTRLATANGPGSNIQERIPLMAMFRRGRGALFAAIVEPTQTGQAPSVTAAELTRTGNGLRLLVRRADGTDEIEWLPDSVTVRRAGQIVLRVNPRPERE